MPALWQSLPKSGQISQRRAVQSNIRIRSHGFVVRLGFQVASNGFFQTFHQFARGFGFAAGLLRFLSQCGCRSPRRRPQRRLCCASRHRKCRSPRKSAVAHWRRSTAAFPATSAGVQAGRAGLNAFERYVITKPGSQFGNSSSHPLLAGGGGDQGKWCRARRL